MESLRQVLAVVVAGLIVGCGGGGGGGGSRPSDNAFLSDLSMDIGALAPDFDQNTKAYGCPTGYLATTTRIAATAADDGASITVNGTPAKSGTLSAPVVLPVGLSTITVEVTSEDGANTETYTIDVTRGTASGVAQEAYLKASNTGSLDGFGNAIAISGDTLVVGAYAEDSNATTIDGDGSDNSAQSSGAVYVFVRTGTGWTEQAYIKASNADSSDNFGVSVAISGDTLVVGATGESSSATGVNNDPSNNNAAVSGAAYVFTRTGTTWTQQAYLKASNTEAGDAFGTAVAISGDTLVVTAQYEDSGATGVNGNESDGSEDGSGAGYVFTRNGSSWSQQAYLKSSNTGADDGFGISVSIDGDTIVIGARSEDSNSVGVDQDGGNDLANASGAAYVFARAGSIWTPQAYLKASNTDPLDFFGNAVAVSGDTVVVTAGREASNATVIGGDQSNDTATNAGAAYVFTRTGATWSQQAYIKASNTDSGDWFGSSAALVGDTLVIGAYSEDSSATGVGGNESDNGTLNSGAVYVFTRSGATWSQAAYLKASNTGADDGFGGNVAFSGDTIVSGAPDEDSNATGVNGNENNNSLGDSGAAYVIR